MKQLDLLKNQAVIASTNAYNVMESKKRSLIFKTQPDTLSIQLIHPVLRGASAHTDITLNQELR